MTEKKTLAQELHTRKIKTPPSFLYRNLMVVPTVINKMLRTEFIYKARPSEEPGSIIMIANHASRNDYLFTAPACWPKKLNYVVGYNEFFRFPLSLLFKIMQVIPKQNFTPDLYCIRQVLKVVKQGGNICIMPEGMSSITGMAQPVIPGVGKLVKKLGIPVYYSKISGAYMTYTKHCLDERKGRIEVVVDRMFSAEDIANMTEAEIEDRMNRLLAHDDYIWNKERQIRFNGRGKMAKNLNTLLYMCPKCGAMYKHEVSGNTMSCTACGNAIEIDECYNIKAADDESVCPELVTDWTIMERQQAAEDVRTEGFSYSGHVKVGVLPDYKCLTGDRTSIIAGEGTLTLDRDGLHFDGILRGEKYSFALSTAEVPTFGMCTDITRFYTFVKGEFIEFFPDDNDVLRWDHLTEEMHRFNGGKWQNTEYRHCE